MARSVKARSSPARLSPARDHPRGCYDRGDDLDACLGPRRRPARSGRRPAATRGRGPPGRSPDPSAELFTFMRDAELRFATLRMRIADTSRRPRVARRSRTSRSASATRAHAKVTTSRAGREVGGDYEIWISDGDLVRTYAGAHKLGTQRPIRNRPRGLDDNDLPGFAQVYEPVTLLPIETLPDTFVHPGGFCQNVLSTGRCTVTGTDRGDRARGDPARLRPSANDRARRRPTRTSSCIDRGRSRDRRHPSARRDRSATTSAATPRWCDLDPDAPLPPSAFEFVFPSGTTMLY